MTQTAHFPSLQRPAWEGWEVLEVWLTFRSAGCMAVPVTKRRSFHGAQVFRCTNLKMSMTGVMRTTPLPPNTMRLQKLKGVHTYPNGVDPQLMVRNCRSSHPGSAPK